MIKLKIARGAYLLAGTTLASAALAPTSSYAQSADSNRPAEATDDSGLDVIVVVAQKREQSLQDVPIAITADQQRVHRGEPYRRRQQSQWFVARRHRANGVGRRKAAVIPDSRSQQLRLGAGLGQARFRSMSTASI